MGSGLSRVQKFFREIARAESLSEADSFRLQPLWIVVGSQAGTRALPIMQAMIAIAVRSYNGVINIRVSAESTPILDRIRSVVEQEAKSYGCSDRLSIKYFDVNEQIPVGIGIGTNQEYLISADASSLLAGINYVFESGWPPPHAAAACFAAAAAFAKYFAVVTLNRAAAARERWVLSLENLAPVHVNSVQAPSQVEPIQIGELHLLGAGAIGSAYAFVARMAADTGTLHIADKDAYDEPNYETTFFINKRMALGRPAKAKALAEYTRRCGLNVQFEPQIEVVQGHEFLNDPCRCFICAVDNTETRRILDAVDADILLNAGLGDNALNGGHVLVTWHKSTTGNLSALFPEHLDTNELRSFGLPSEITDECSQIDYEGVSFSAPFLALAAGSLLYALSRQSAVKRLTGPNYFKIDLLGVQSAISLRSS